MALNIKGVQKDSSQGFCDGRVSNDDHPMTSVARDGYGDGSTVGVSRVKPSERDGSESRDTSRNVNDKGTDKGTNKGTNKGDIVDSGSDNNASEQSGEDGLLNQDDVNGSASSETDVSNNAAGNSNESGGGDTADPGGTAGKGASKNPVEDAKQELKDALLGSTDTTSEHAEQSAHGRIEHEESVKQSATVKRAASTTGSMVQAAGGALTAVGSTFLGIGGALGGALASGAAAAGSALMGVAVAVGSAAAAGFMSAVGFVGSVLGVSTLTSVLIVSGVVAVGVIVVVCGIAMVASTNPAQWDSSIEDCRVAVTKAETDESGTTSDEQTIANAQKVYSVLHTYGFSDELVAGVLGNLQAESHITADIIEGGDKLSAYPTLDDVSNHTVNDLGYTSDGYLDSRTGKYVCGMGLMQWTASRGTDLYKAAESVGMDPWDIDMQTMYMLVESGSQTAIVDYMAKCAGMSAGDASYWWLVHAERPANPEATAPFRRENAEMYLDLIKTWDPDTDYGQSIIDKAGTIGDVASGSAVERAQDDCVSTKELDNSSIATTALSYAYPQRHMAVGNDGTELWQRMVSFLEPDRGIYRSCDRNTATAVRFSGADPNIPMGSVATQLTYYEMNSAVWRLVTPSFSMDQIDKLEPGDVFIAYGGSQSHTFIYVGNELVQKKFTQDEIENGRQSGDASWTSANVVEASIGTGNDWTAPDARSPAVQSLERSSLAEYKVYRCMNKNRVPISLS